MDIKTVILSKGAKKDLMKVPKHVALKLMAWIEAVSYDGLRVVRETPSYHDEPLKGKRKGQRSIRLSKAYRAIYVLGESGEVVHVEIVEVNKHEY